MRTGTSAAESSRPRPLGLMPLLALLAFPFFRLFTVAAGPEKISHVQPP